MTRVTARGDATPHVVAAIVAALRVLVRDDAAKASPRSRPSAWRRAARREALRAPRP